jgi:hypothetical protein
MRVLFFLFVLWLKDAKEWPAFNTNSYIISPSQESPLHISRGQDLKVKVKLRIALTPPPGVQQKKALLYWKAWLLNPYPGIPYQTKKTKEVYPLEIKAIRGSSHPFIYIAEFKLPPWIPENRYHLKLKGPGLSSISKNSVFIKGKLSKRDKQREVFLSQKMFLIEKRYKNKALVLKIKNNSSKRIRSWLKFIIPWTPRGYILKDLRTKRIIPLAQVGILNFRKNKRPQRIVYYYPIDLAPLGEVFFQFKKRAGLNPLRSKIYVSRQKVRAGEAVNFRAYTSKRNIIEYFWDLGDRTYKEGRWISHRFMDIGRFKVFVFVFSRFGESASAYLSLKVHLLGRGCEIKNFRDIFW